MSNFHMHLSKVFIAIVFTLLEKGESICLFPPEFEGEFIIQNALVNSDVMQYSTINITADWIYPYGQCYARNDSNIIVVLSPEENTCFRCFNLQMVSKNVILLIHNEGDINSKCSSTAEIAALKCPGAIALLNDEEKFQNDFHSIILYRTSERESPRRSEFCPFDFFDGEIKFDYYLDENRLCSGYESTLSQCPSGSMLNLRFRGCSNGSPSSVKFECIGHWSALGEHYLAVIDWINGTVPRYKCGTYHYDNDEKTEITLKINSDCSSFSRVKGFVSASKSQQIFRMQKSTDLKVSTDIEFPSWIQGRWQFLTVNKSFAIFRDLSSLKSYSMTLINQLKGDKFIVLSRSQCGEESFKCLYIRKLDANILEFQSSSESAKQLKNVMLCNDEHFDNKRWITMSREGKDIKKTSCPVSGKYLGRLPDDDQLCSMMTSNCNSDIMHFQIGPCDSSEIYEKRIYRCLGQWTDRDSSTVFTYTKRVDDVVDVYECFVGINPAGSQKKIIIKEAGDSCYKMLDVENYGMEMNQTEPCRLDNAVYDEVLVKPTQDDLSIIYKTVFDDDSNSIDFTTTISTKKPKISKNHKNQMQDENSVELITSAARTMIHSLGLLVMINSLLIIL